MTTIEGIKGPGETKGWVSQRGQLVVGDGAVEFRGKSGTLRMAPVRDIFVEQPLVVVSYGEEEPVRATFIDLREGYRKAAARADPLATELRELLGFSPEKVADLERGRAAAAVEEGHVAKSKGNRTIVAGTLSVLIALAVALIAPTSDVALGFFLVAWFPGWVVIFTGWAQRRKAARAASGEPPRFKVWEVLLIGLGGWIVLLLAVVVWVVFFD